MKLWRNLTVSGVQFTFAILLAYGLLYVCMTPLMFMYPSATRFTHVLSNLLVFNKSRDTMDFTTRTNLSLKLVANVSRGNLNQKENHTDVFHRSCPNFQNEHGYVLSELPFPCSHLMVLAGSRGRTGNQMFQFAALFGIARRHNYSAFVKPSFPLLRYFDISHVTNLNITGAIRLGEGKSGEYSKSVENINESHNYSVDGYFQSWKYFNNIREEIRNVFKIKQIYLDEAEQFVERIQIHGYSKVCVHVRRGDIHSKQAVRQGYSVGGLDFIHNAMNYFTINHSPVQFIIVSEDKDWCRLHLKRNDTVISPFHLIPVDFAVLTLCDHVIITSGTFGWWGGWLSSGTVIYYRDFPRPNSWLATQINKDDYYPPHWIPMV